MNTDIRVAVGMTTHPKTIKLMRRCGDRAFFCLISLWSWAALNRPDGDFSGMDREDVEIVAGWNGDFGFFADQLCEIGFMDCEDGNFSLHDWTVHNPWVACAEDRSDAGRLNRLKRIMPEEYERLVKAGSTGVSKEEYERLKHIRKKALFKHPSSTLQDGLKDTLSEPLTPAPAPAPAPAPVPTPNVKEKEREGADAPPPPLDCPHEQIIGIYHDMLPQCPRVRSWGESSRKALRSRWREDSARQSPEWWREFFLSVAASDFLTGKVNGSKGDPFIANLNWLVKPTNFEKVLNGAYGQAAIASSGHTRENCDYYARQGACKDRDPAKCSTCSAWKEVIR